MKIAVTGASGHIGNCLVKELLKSGARIKVLVHNSTYGLDKLGIEIIRGNLLDKNSLNELCKDVDVVFHLAARISIDNSNYKKIYETNVIGTQNLLDAAKKSDIKKFIHFSSIHAFNPKPTDEILDETRPLITSGKIAYEYTKAESERLVLKEAENGLDAIILNPTAVIGPYDYHNSFLGQALRLIYNNKLPMLIMGGYNWVDVRDVVHASIRAITNGRKGEKYILAGNYCSLKELSGITSKIKQGKTPGLVAPLFLAHIACPFFKVLSLITGKDPLYTYQSLHILAMSPKKISCEKARKELNYNPRPLEESLKDTFEWYISNKLM